MFWRKEPPIFNDDGTLIMGGMFDHQFDWWHLPNFIKALISGYGGGKTFIAAKKGISLTLFNNGSPHLVISPSYKIAKRTTILAYQELLEGKSRLLENFSFNYNKTDHEFTIFHGARRGVVWVASGDEPESLKGPTVGSAAIDEPFIQKREVFDQALARVRDPRAKTREIHLTGTPESLNWGYDICEGELKGNYDLGIVRASTKDNLALPDTYYDTLLKAYDEKAAQAYLEGLFINLQTGLVYYNFDRFVNVKQIEMPGDAEIGIGTDFNVNPMASIAFWIKDDHMHVFKEYEFANADTQYMVGVWKDDFGDRIKAVYPDASGRSRHSSSPGGKSDFYYIENPAEGNLKINCHRINPKVRDRENAINGKFKSKDGKTTLTIDPSCKKLISYFSRYSHENKNKTDGKAMSHLIDAFGYPVAYLFPIIKEHSRTVEVSIV